MRHSLFIGRWQLEYLVTNLMPEQIAKENFPDLYTSVSLGVESKYRELKNRLLK